MSTTAKKKKSKLRHIPNILSISRVPIAISFFFLAGLPSPYPFLAAYGVAGLNDVLDGFLARRFHWQSKLGAKMDSIGDAIFLGCAITVALLMLDEVIFEPYVFIIFGVLVAVRLVNIVITRRKFKQWGFIHNLFMKYSTVPVFFLMPVAVLTKAIPNLFLAIMLRFIILGSLEETWILMLMEDYDMDMKSIYHMRKLKRQRALEYTVAEEEERETTRV